MTFRIAYIDEVKDDRETYSHYIKGDSEEIDFALIDPYSDEEALINLIIEEKYDAILVDYTLYAERSDIKYSGVQLIRNLWARREDFPAFILTNNRENNDDNIEEKFKSTLVFVKKSVKKDAEEIRRKIINEIKFYYNENERLKKKLTELDAKICQGEDNDHILQEVKDIDRQLERRINYDRRFTDVIRDSKNMKSLSNLLNEAETFLKNLNDGKTK